MALLAMGILLDSVKNKIISPWQAIQDIDNLVGSGYRISEDIIERLKETLSRWDRLKASLMIQERIRDKFLREILDMYAKGELAASKAA